MRIENTRSTDKPLATVSHPHVYGENHRGYHQHPQALSHPHVYGETDSLN